MAIFFSILKADGMALLVTYVATVGRLNWRWIGPIPMNSRDDAKLAAPPRKNHWNLSMAVVAGVHDERTAAAVVDVANPPVR